MVGKTFYSRGQSYSYQKGSILTTIVDRQYILLIKIYYHENQEPYLMKMTDFIINRILLLQQFGLTNFANKRAASKSHNPCATHIKATRTVTVGMKLKETADAFIVLATGIGLAVLTFIAELVYGKITKKKDSTNY